MIERSSDGANQKRSECLFTYSFINYAEATHKVHTDMPQSKTLKYTKKLDTSYQQVSLFTHKTVSQRH